MKFKNKQDLTNWAYKQFDLFGIDRPENYTADEIAQYCPEIPRDFIDRHVKSRDSK